MVKAQLMVFKDTMVPYINAAGAITFYEKDCGKSPQHSHAELLEDKEYTEEELGIIKKKYGAKKMIIFQKDGNRRKEDLPDVNNHQYFNANLNRLIIDYKLSKQLKKITEIGDEHFLIPVRFSTYKKNDYPLIKYLNTKNKNDGKMYHVVFSDYEEYRLWNQMTKANWKLVIVSKYDLMHINKNYGVLINPCGNRLVIEGDKKKLFYQKKQPDKR